MNLQYPFGNHIGEQFGHLLAVDAIETDGETGDPVIYDCKCMKCGKEHIRVLDRDLLSFKARCCIDCNRFDLTGMKFGRWTVLRGAPSIRPGRPCWLCECTCGTRRIIDGNRLTTRNTLSCGCLHREILQRLNFNDLSGKTFGKLTVIKRIENGPPMPSCKHGVVRYECKCECGNTCIRPASTLRNGLTTSCGCMRRTQIAELHFKDLTGKRFGRLVVINRAQNRGDLVCWNCKCDCGRECVISSRQLLCNHTKSCGCLKIDKLRERMTKWTPDEIPIVRRYRGMMQRCYNPNSTRYPGWGGRGITVCDEWKNDPRKFVDWAKSNGFREDLSIDRINVDGNYCPDNCRWVDNITQANNKQTHKYIDAHTVKHLLQEWASESGRTYDNLFSQLSKDHTFFTNKDIDILKNV